MQKGTYEAGYRCGSGEQTLLCAGRWEGPLDRSHLVPNSEYLAISLQPIYLALGFNAEVRSHSQVPPPPQHAS